MSAATEDEVAPGIEDTAAVAATPADGRPEFGALARAEGVATGYAGAEPVLTGLSFSVGAGERIAVLGPNGGGKTTLFRLLLGELEARAGRLEVTAQCATVPQTDRSRLDYPVSALDVVLMGTLATLPWWRRPGATERSSAREALDAVALADHADVTFGELSGGQRQRVLIARALVQDARILLLDEPFAGLDTPSAERLEELVAALAAEGRAVLIATHEVEQAFAWERVLCLNREQIAFGVPGVVLTRPVLERTYGAAIVELPGGGRGLLPPHHHDHA